MADSSMDESSTNESLTDATSTTSFGDISVCEEIGQLIESCEGLHEHIHNSYETIQNIQKLVENNQNINVTYNGWSGDFEDLLENFHQEALEKIKNGQQNNFGEIILNALEIITFGKN